MAHPNAVPWDAAILAKLGTAPYNTMAQDGSADVQIAAMMNAEAVTPSGHVDVQIADVESYLALQGKMALLDEFSAGNVSGSNPPTQNDLALIAAKELMRIIESPRLSIFQMSDDTHYAGINAFLGYLVANGNLTSADQSAILALANPAPIPWWKSIGSHTPLNEHDLARARTP